MLVLKVQLEQQGHKVTKVFKEILDLQGHKVLQGQLGHKVLQEVKAKKARLVLKVQLEQTVQLEQQVILEQLVHRVFKVIQGLLELKEILVLLVQPDLLGQQGQQVTKAVKVKRVK